MFIAFYIIRLLDKPQQLLCTPIARTLEIHRDSFIHSVFHSQCLRCLSTRYNQSTNPILIFTVRTHDYDYAESEMDERESLYFDTISLAESEAAAVAAAHRKSLSQSRNTIYHSAVDLAGDEARNSMRMASGGIPVEHMRMGWQPGYRQSTALEHLNGGGGDHTDAAIAAQVLALQNGRTHLPTGIGVASGGAGGGGSGYGHSISGGGGGDDEVSRRLLRQSSTVSNKDKKLPITYSQWKLRVNNQIQTKYLLLRSTIYDKRTIRRSENNIYATRSTQHIYINIINSLFYILYSLFIYITQRTQFSLFFFSITFCIYLDLKTLSHSHSHARTRHDHIQFEATLIARALSLTLIRSLLLVALFTPFGFSCIYHICIHMRYSVNPRKGETKTKVNIAFLHI